MHAEDEGSIMTSVTMETPTSPPEARPEEKPVPQKRQGVNAFFPTLGLALLLATLFTAWTPDSLFASNLQEKLMLMLTPQAPPQVTTNGTPQPQIQIGIVAGHSGNDSGAVCTDENGNVTLTEAEINLRVAQLTQENLQKLGYKVDLLNEFDTRLSGYRAVALVSIHNDSCEFVNEEATGFKVAASKETRDVNRAQRLTACLVDRYQRATKLNYHSGSITADMTEYHAFSEIDPNTVTAIIETGFLYADRKILTEDTDLVASGVTQGILCFLNNENVLPTAAP